MGIPILFSGEMVRAILDGRKTQTRRVIKPQPLLSNVALGCASAEERQRLELQWLVDNDCPHGKPGDLLWVRETWLELDRSGWCDPAKPKDWYDAAFGRINAIAYRANADTEAERIRKEYGYKWRPSIFMPRWASRLTLRVVDVRVEQVKNISDMDVLAEGIPQKGRMYDPSGITFSDELRADFRSLWDSINAKRGYSWDSNPWVWVVEFERVTS